MRTEELHVVRIKRELDDILQKNTLNKRRLMEHLDFLTTLSVDTDLLQRTQIGRTVNSVRKTFISSRDINQKAVKLIKQWKQLVKNEHETRRKSVSSTHSDEGLCVQISSPDSSTITSGNGDDNEEKDQRYSPVINNGDGGDDDHAYFTSNSTTKTKRSNDYQHPRAAKIGRRSNSVSSTSSSTATSDESGSGNDRTTTKPRGDTRNTSVKLIREALLSGDEPPPKHPQGKNSMDLAIEIENYIFDEIGNADDRHYKSRVRSRVMNLKDKKNPALRNNILMGKLSTRRVASMNVDELASDQLKQLRRSIEEESLRNREINADPSTTHSDLYQCEQCHVRDVDYSIVMEKAKEETQCVCNRCGHRWRAY